MKFDLVIGNPPYNNDIYLDFSQFGFDISSKYILMITPAKWQAKTDGKPANSRTPDKNEEFRNRLVPYISHIVYYRDVKDVFDIGEPGGISYFLIDKTRKSEITLVKNICSRNIHFNSDWEPHDEVNPLLLPHRLIKIIAKFGQLTVDFNQSKYVQNSIDKQLNLMEELEFKSRNEFVKESDYGDPVKYENSIEITQGDTVIGYKQPSELLNTFGVDKYKCVQNHMGVHGSSSPFSKDTSQALGSNNIFIVKPNQVPSGSYIVVKYTDNLEEALSFKSYINSKTMSLMQFFGICGTTVTREFFRFIPDPKDWSVVYVDKAHPGVEVGESGKYTLGNKTYCSLYSKYNLTKEDIAIVESIIKSRN